MNDFLNRLKNYINSSDFDINCDLFLSAGRNRQNYNALLMLDFELADVVGHLATLSFTNYSHTFLDNDNNDPPYLFVFGKYISGKLIYIKIKLRNIGVRKKKLFVFLFMKLYILWIFHFYNIVLIKVVMWKNRGNYGK